MRRISLSASCVVAALALAQAANAQATRTWVSGVGDDANPCSRTAPCKTFPGAISKTAAGGEINVLDPGGFGGVTITKSITISAEGVEAGVLVSGTNAIIISTTDTTAVVVLRGLDIEGLGTGLDGVKLLTPIQALHIENCTINAFRGTNGNGIEIAPSSGSTEVYINNTIVRNSGQGSGGGILVKPTSTASVKTVLDNVLIENNLFGLRADASASTGNLDTSVKNGSTGGNTNASLLGVGGGIARNQMQIDGTIVSDNGFGPRADNAMVRFGRTIVTGNGTGLSAVNSGQLISYGTNQSHGNTIEGVPTATIPQI